MAPPAEPKPSVAEPSSELPDWLREMAPPAEPAKPPAAEPASELPDWLQGMAPPAEPAKPSAVEPASELPDWLREMAPPAGPEPPAAAAPSVETPDWLQDISQAPIAAPGGEAEIPDWLRDVSAPLPPVEQPPELEPSGMPDFEPAGVPDWLKGVSPPFTAPEARVGEAPPLTPLAAEGLPDWLRGMAPPSAPEKAPVAEQPIPELPDWIKEKVRPPESAALPAEEEEILPSVVPLSTEQLPAWLQEMKASAPPRATGEQAAPAPGAGPLGMGEESGLPAWIEALRPKELTPGGAVEEPQAVSEEVEGILAGLRDTLPVAAVAGQTLGSGVSLQFEVPAGALSRAGMFNEVLTHGVGALVRRGGESRVQKLWGPTQRLFVFFLVLLAVVAPQIPAVHETLVASVGQPAFSDAGQQVQKQINQLPEGVPVLVSFDYDPTQAGEMDVVARAVLEHLIARKARILAVSTYPVGPATAQALWTDIISGTGRDSAGGFVNLGYIPGQAVGVQMISSLDWERAARTDFTGAALAGADQPALLEGVNSLRDVSLIVELAATPDSVRWWVEQLAAQPQAPPLVAGVSAMAAPMSRPYLSGKRTAQPAVPQLSGLINGMPEALAYLSTQPGVAPPADYLQTFESLVLASLALGALIVVGNTVQLLAQLRRRR